MRISDWSSDVCSSDLDIPGQARLPRRHGPARGIIGPPHRRVEIQAPAQRRIPEQRHQDLAKELLHIIFAGAALEIAHVPLRRQRQFVRSEEYTSELQSLMRFSYDFFCLTKKKTHNISTPASH